MARKIQRRNLSPMLTAADEWRGVCLVDDKAMFCKESLWSIENVQAMHRAFVERPDNSSRDFLTKLKDQLRDTPPAVQRLAAEMLWVLALFPSNIKPATKSRQFREIWSLSGAEIPLPRDFPELEDACLAGIGSGGPGYNTYRADELAFLVTLVRDLKTRSRDERKDILDDYSSFVAWLAQVPQVGRRQFRHMLRYFLFPDRVERISSDSDRRLILAGFGVAPVRISRTWSDFEVDEALSNLRQGLEAAHPDQVLDFYEPPLRERWSRESRVKTPDGVITVTVPDDLEDDDVEEPTSEEGKPAEARQSFQVQAKLAEIGATMGYQVWLPAGDRTRVVELMSKDKREAILATLPLNFDETTFGTIKQIDVIWIKDRAIVRAFEVEHTTSVYSGLLRMADLLALQPNIDIRLHIVAADARRRKVFAEMRRPVFSLLARGPLSQRCSFISYENVDTLHGLDHLSFMTDRIISEFEELAEEE